MKKQNCFIMGVVLICSFFFINFNAFAMSSETEMLLKLLEKKGIVTTEEAADLKQSVEAAVPQAREDVGKLNVSDRLDKLENKVSKTAFANDFLERVEISGLIEVEGYASSRGSGDHRDSSDITLATVELGIDAQINEWVSGHLLFLYEEDDTEDVTVDEGTITFGNTERFPLYLTVGKMYVPFGNFESNMIQDPLTLELGETRESAAQIGFESAGFYGSVYVFNGDIGETNDNNKVDNYGANIGFAFEQDQLSFDVGVDYINNITDSDGLTDALSNVAGEINDNAPAGAIAAGFAQPNDETDDYVAGFAVHLIMNMGPLQLIGEYVGAVEEYALQNEIWGAIPYSFGVMGEKSVKPESWNIEAAFTQEILGKETTFALAYQGTKDCVFMQTDSALPENRYMAAIGMNILKNTALTLEYTHDIDYGKHEGGTDQKNDTVSAQVAIEF